MSDDKKQITKTGILSAIRFQKTETSFLIGIFTDTEEKNKTFSGLGTMLNPQVGLTYKLTGELEVNPKFGEQLKFSSFETVLPRDENGIFKYIVRLCKFVGVKVGNDLVDLYKSDTLTIMKEDPERVAREIRGITPERAKEIQKTLINNEKIEAITVELLKLLDIPGLRKDLPSELILKFGSNAAEIVKENPYILTSFHGTSFILADRVAIDMGTNPRSIERKKAALCHIIKEKMSGGSIWVEERDLIMETASLIGVMGVEEGVKVLFDEQVITAKHGCTTQGQKWKWYAFSNSAEMEGKIADKLAEIMSNEPLLKTVKVEGGDFDRI